MLLLSHISLKKRKYKNCNNFRLNENELLKNIYFIAIKFLKIIYFSLFPKILPFVVINFKKQISIIL